MRSLKFLPLVMFAALSLGASAGLSLPAHAGSVPCTAGPPVCDNPNDPHDPGNPGNPGDPNEGMISPDIMVIACRISGDPVLLPDDLKFRNIGMKVIPAGTRVYWDVKATNDKGFFVLANDLLPDKELPDADVLSAGTSPHNHCRPRIM